MRDRVTTWSPVVFLILLASLTYWLDRMVQPPPPRNDGSTRHDPDYTVENFTATRMGLDGTPRHVLAASKMVHYPDDDSTHLTNPNFTRYEKGSPPLHIRALTGLVSSNGEHVYFTGNVVVTREAFGGRSQTTMTTSYLHIVPDQDLAVTDKPVVIQDAHTIVNGVGLELNNKTQVLKLLSRVKGRYDNPKH
jgi:lipopolysaccharide export system protein LptC